MGTNKVGRFSTMRAEPWGTMFPLAQSRFSMHPSVVCFLLGHEPGEVNLEVSGHEKKGMKFEFLASDVSVFGGCRWGGPWRGSWRLLYSSNSCQEALTVTHDGFTLNPQGGELVNQWM